MKKLLIISTFLVSQVALSQTFDYTKKWGVGASFGLNFPIFGNSFNEEANPGQTWSLYGRHHMTAADALELAFSKHEFLETTKALNVYDLTYVRRLNPTGRFSPILGAGVGVVDIANYDPNSLKLGLKLRTGLEYAINENVNFGFNLDYQHVNKMLWAANLPGGNIHDIAARVGLTWYYGGAGGIAATAAAATGAATMVTSSKALDIYYPTGGTQINQAYNKDMKELAQYMEEHPKANVELQGYSDNTGSPSINKKISQQRAEEVKGTLTKDYGVDTKRVNAVGYGEDKPFETNQTAEGRTANRRVIGVVKQ